MSCARQQCAGHSKEKRPGLPGVLVWPVNPENAQRLPNQAAASQYPALNGLLMRSARGDTSTSLSVGIFSPLSVAAGALTATSVP